MKNVRIANKEIMIAGIRRQHEILLNLASTLEAKELFDESDHKLYESVAKEVEENLKKLRRLGSDILKPQSSTLFYFL